MLILLLISAVAFDFLNGFHDSSNIVATVISSRAMKPKVALYLTALMNFIAPFIFGVAVAEAVGKNVIDSSSINVTVVIAATLSAVIWNILTWYLGIPSSSSHALVGGLLGAAILAQGPGVVKLNGLFMILIALLISPPLGFLIGNLLMRFVRFTFKNVSPRINNTFKRLQIFTSLGLALAHGSNDAQKTMGIITLGLISYGYQSTFHVPLWVIALSAGSFALGTASGGWRLIRTLGGRIYKIRPADAFTSQAASAAVILGAAILGGPVSTTHVISSAIMGAGAADRVNKVRWQIGLDMLITWGLTIPATAAVSALIHFLLVQFY